MGTAQQRVRLARDLEDVFRGTRIDLVVLADVDPFLALDAVSGDLLYTADKVREAEYELYVLGRAGDLAPFERERRALLLSGVR